MIEVKIVVILYGLEKKYCGAPLFMTETMLSIHQEILPIPGYKKVIKIEEDSSGLKAIIAIHDSTLGPALGGIRIHPYSDFDTALKDVLRLSRGMTYKSAIAGCGLGGGKSVIIANPKNGEKTEQLLEAFAQVVDSLEGEYICAEDVGCSTKDVEIISKITPYVVGLDHEKSSGDPSYFTAWGTYLGIKASWKFLTGSESLAGVRILVQGLGAVGEKLVEWLFWEQAEVLISDIDSLKIKAIQKRFGLKVIDPSLVFETECDIFSPCAMGGIINQNHIPKLKCKLVAGCANNQLLDEKDDERLLKSGILYAPDFVINAGGLLNVSIEIRQQGYDSATARDAVAKIPLRLQTIYTLAKSKQIGTEAAALILAEERIRQGIDKRVEPPVFHHQHKICKI